MGPLRITKDVDQNGKSGVWVHFYPDEFPTFICQSGWVGVDFDGTLARTDNAGHFFPPYPLGEPIPEMVAMVKTLLEAGITVKIFSARACEPASIPVIQAWTQANGLGCLEVTNVKDFNLIRFFDDRAIQVVPNKGRHISFDSASRVYS